MKKVVAKMTYESFYAVWKIVYSVAEVIYKIVCDIDKWLMDHGE